MTDDRIANVVDITARVREKLRYKLTESGNAERFAHQHRDKARYVGTHWKIWDGKRWAKDDRLAVQLLGKQTIESLDLEVVHEQDDDRRKALRAHASKSSSRAGRENMVALARAELPAVAEDFDRDQFLLNVANGTIDLRTGELRAHNPEDMISKLAPVVYDPGATAPRWENFLAESVKDPELIVYLQRLVGYALSGSTREQIFLFSFGAGDNGKGVFHDTVAKLLGDYANAAVDSLFFVARNEGHPASVASLDGARFVVASEVPAGKQFDEQLLKKLTGEDVMRTRNLYEGFFDMRPVCKLFFCGNHKPEIRGLDWAIWRRVRLIPWDVIVAPDKRDLDLRTKLLVELPGILNWAIRGCLEWQAHGLTLPEAVKRATAYYREESDPVSGFFMNRCEFSPEFRVPRAALRQAYEIWCHQEGIKLPLGPKRFAESLQAKSKDVKDDARITTAPGVQVRAWSGVRLRAQ